MHTHMLECVLICGRKMLFWCADCRFDPKMPLHDLVPAEVAFAAVTITVQICRSYVAARVCVCVTHAALPPPLLLLPSVLLKLRLLGLWLVAVGCQQLVVAISVSLRLPPCTHTHKHTYAQIPIARECICMCVLGVWSSLVYGSIIGRLGMRVRSFAQQCCHIIAD